MNIDQQIQALIDQSPQDGSTPALVEAIAPVLKLLASQLRHLQYYIVQTLDQNWVFTTFTNQTQPGSERNVIYAYSTLKDITTGSTLMNDPQMIALPIPVASILFQMLAMDTIHSIVFFETPGDVTAGTEIQRQELDDLIHDQLTRLQSPTPTLPPDIAWRTVTQRGLFSGCL